MEKKDIKSLTLEELEREMAQMGEKPLKWQEGLRR